MENKNTFRQYAPYLYLSRPEGEECYHLFVAIRKRVNEEVAPALTENGHPIHYGDGLTTLAFTIASGPDGPDGEDSDFFLMHYELMPDVIEFSDFGPVSAEVQVKVTVQEEDGLPIASYSNSISYVDADTQPLPEGQLDSEPAYNCPYIYLEPEGLYGEEEAGKGHTFYPYVLLAPKGYRLAGGKEKIIATSPANGVLESILVLFEGDDTLEDESFFPFANPAILEVNAQKYSDSGQGEGNFSVTVVFEPDEGKAEAFRDQEPLLLHHHLLGLEQASSDGNNSGRQPAGTSAYTLRKAKTRNMSSRRKNSRSVPIWPLA